MKNRITFKKIKFKNHPRDVMGRRTRQGFTIVFTRWVLLLDGKRIPDIYISNLLMGQYESIYEGQTLGRRIESLDCYINFFLTLLDAKKALVEHFNKHYEGRS